MSTQQPPAQVFVDLREQLFREGAGSQAASPERVVGVVAELGSSGGSALLFGLRSGEASMYFSSGGGVIGGGEHEAVRAAAGRLCDEGERSFASLPRVPEPPDVPSTGWITFSLLTQDALRADSFAAAEVEDPSHPLHALFVGMHGLITELRRIDEGDEGDEGGEPPAQESGNEGAYANCLLTVLAQNPGAATTLRPNEALPDPATLSGGADEKAWVDSHGFRFDALDAAAVIDMLVGSTEFGRIRRSVGTLAAKLAGAGGSLVDVTFRIERRPDALVVRCVP